MVIVQQGFSAATEAFMTVNERWPAVVLSTVTAKYYTCLQIKINFKMLQLVDKPSKHIFCVYTLRILQANLL